MIKNLIFIICALFVFETIGFPGKALSETITKSKKSKPTKISSKNNVPFNQDAETCPKNITNDIKSIYSAYVKQKSLLTKNELESTKVFDERIKNICTKKLAGYLKYCDTVAFMSSVVDYNREHFFKYDADNEKLIVSEKHWGFDIERTLANKRTYRASNAYNASAIVKSTTYDVYQIEYDNDVDIDYKIPMSPIEAKEAKKWAEIVMIGKLKYPFIDYKEELHEATISDTDENLDRIHTIHLDLAEVWIVNKKTGKIYYKDIIKYDKATVTQIIKEWSATYIEVLNQSGKSFWIKSDKFEVSVGDTVEYPANKTLWKNVKPDGLSNVTLDEMCYVRKIKVIPKKTE